MRPSEPPDLTRFGLPVPSTDFFKTKSGIAMPYQSFVIDLSTARSIGAGTVLRVPINGNSFYIDQAPDVGAAYAFFVDTAFSGPPVRMYLQPGSNARLPFTGLLIENTAQAGKFLRILYGVDIDFKPGVTGTVSITGTLDTRETGITYGAAYRSNTALAANTPETVFLPAANLNGARIVRANFSHRGSGYGAFIAKSSAPATAIDGDVILGAQVGYTASGAQLAAGGALQNPLQIAAGLGLYFISGPSAEVDAHRSCLYTLL